MKQENRKDIELQRQSYRENAAQKKKKIREKMRRNGDL